MLRLVAALDEDFDAGRARGGVAVEHVALDLAVVHGEGHIAAIVERLVDGLDAVGFGLEGEDGAFERVGPERGGMGFGFSGHKGIFVLSEASRTSAFACNLGTRD